MIYQGDCLEYLRTLSDNSVDAVVTDPPYGLGKEPDPREVLSAWLDGNEFKPGGSGFMGKSWDAFVPSPLVWAECLRVLKPGGHLVAFAGSRTYDWIALGVRLAGFEIRDQIMWIYGSGFPKSHNVSKAIDKAAGVERKIVGTYDPRSKFDGKDRKSKAISERWRQYEGRDDEEDRMDWSSAPITAPATEAARQWDGWGTALKPAHEPIVLARKPLVGTVAHNVTTHGTGAINVDGCRVHSDGSHKRPFQPTNAERSVYGEQSGFQPTNAEGRWPANILHDGSPKVLAVFPETAFGTGSTRGASSRIYGGGKGFTAQTHDAIGFGDTGSAARFFYCAKASRAERELGLADFAPETVGDGRQTANDTAYQRGKTERRNVHPTVKPVAVMRWLTRLVTPPGGVVLDPYTGSGTTGVAAALEGFEFIGCELSPEYCTIAESRVAHAKEHPKEWDATHGAPVQTTLF